MNGANLPVKSILVKDKTWRSQNSKVIREVPVSLTVNGELWLTFMCTPIDLEDLGVGFLFNEGLVQSFQDIADVRICTNIQNIDIWTRHPLGKPDQWRRTSGCTGGMTHVEKTDVDDQNHSIVLTNGGTLTPSQISYLVGRLFKAQELYRQSGGVHTSTLTNGEDIFVTAEDIGRHNTLDKIAGRCLRQNIQLSRRILLTTGRISSEMLQKAVRMNTATVITRTSPTSLSIELADQIGITLIGYARQDQFIIYTHPERIHLETAIKVKELENH